MNREFWVKAPARVQRIQLLPEDLAEIQEYAALGGSTVSRDGAGVWTISKQFTPTLTCNDGDWVADLGWELKAGDSVVSAVDAWNQPAYQRVDTATAVYTTQEPSV